MKLRKLAVCAICGIMIMTGSNAYGITTSAQEEEMNVIQENDTDNDEEFEESDSLLGWGDNEWLNWLNGIRGIKEKQSNGIKSIKYWIDKDIDYYYVFDYDVNGYMTKCTVWTYGKITQIFSFEYDNNGNKIKLNNNEADGNLLGYNVYEYDSNGKLSKDSFYENKNDNLKVTDYSLYEYDDNGNIIKKSRNTDNVIKESSYEEYEYNNGKITKRTEYIGKYVNGVITGYEPSGYATWEYDGYGNPVKYKEYLGGEVFSYIEYKYDDYGRKIQETLYEVREDMRQIYDYDVNGNLIKKTYILSDGTEFYDDLEYEYYDFAQHVIQTTGIYCASNYPSIQAGINIQKSNENDVVEYRWVGCNNKNPNEWFEVSPWTKENNWMSWTPGESGGYVFVCYARVVGNEDKSEIQYAFGTEYHKDIKGICQMPYTREGGGYLIGIESYDNPNHAYQYEMLILDCNLYMQGKDAWVYTTGRCGAEDNCLWTVWQPQYGYYWTLFRIYDADGNLIDEACYGFENVN